MPPGIYLLVGAAVGVAASLMERFYAHRMVVGLEPGAHFRLQDHFSRQRSLGTYFPLGIMLMILSLGYGQPRIFPWAFLSGLGLTLIIVVVLQVGTWRFLATLDLPPGGCFRLRFKSLVVQLGHVLAMALVTYGISQSI